MNSAKKAVSPALQEANRRLHLLRQQRCRADQADLDTADFQQARSRDVEELAVEPVAGLLDVLPAHLGWGSARLTAVLRERARRARSLLERQRKAKVNGAAVTNLNEQTRGAEGPVPHWTADKPDSVTEAPNWVKLYPDIGMGMLREGETAPGRLWLMLRHLDRDGCGVLRIVIVAGQLTKKKSNQRLCGKRQLRNLLRDGEGVYWTRENGRLWLRSAARVAAALGVGRLGGRPVALPVAAVLEGIGAFKAHLYAAFHSGRVKETPHGERSMPIARQTLAGLSGVGRSSQRTYEETVGVKVQANFAVGELAETETGRGQARLQERGWRQGRAVFELKDYRGRQGRKGKSYLCWQLPNSYQGGHDFRPRGRQRKINRKLKDLVTRRAPGNEEGLVEKPRPEKVYYPNGKMAAKAYGQDPARERYWQQGKVENGRFVAWQQMGEVG